MKRFALDLTPEQWKEYFVSVGEKPFRAEQVFRSLHKGLKINGFTDLSKPLRERLKEDFDDQGVIIVKSLKSVDGTEKFLFKMPDGEVIEGVLMRYKYGNTLCVSTQVGCRMNCGFCASGLNGLIRNLSSGEILGEVLSVNAYLGGELGENRKITNIVLMGSGEPLDNYDNTVDFLKLVSEKNGINISPRNISLSTCGIVPKIYDLAKEKYAVNLTVSLHSPFDSERKRIMPIANAYSISEILDACAHYFSITGRRYIFEYVLIKNENDTDRHADELIRLLKGRPCHINLIRLNEVKERSLKGGTEKDAYRFLGKLIKGGLSATLRRKIGEDIDGACGQLRRRYLQESDNH